MRPRSIQVYCRTHRIWHWSEEVEDRCVCMTASVFRAVVRELKGDNEEFRRRYWFDYKSEAAQ